MLQSIGQGLGAHAIVAATGDPGAGAGAGGAAGGQGAGMGGAPSFLNTGSIVGLLGFIVMVLAVWLGISQMSKAKKGNIKEAAQQSGVAAIGMLWIVLGFFGGGVMAIYGLYQAFFNAGGSPFGAG